MQSLRYFQNAVLCRQVITKKGLVIKNISILFLMKV